jgi:quercetin 2,3-dioxygenase
MTRTPAWIRAAKTFENPAQTDRSRHVLPYDPQANDPFLMMAEDWFSRTGFDWHPHRGFETITVVLDGTLEHRDNAGGSGVLHAGDVQWTTTGSGVLHTEVAHQRKGVHTLQLWLNLPRRLKMSPPRYQDLRAAEAPVAHGKDADVRVFSGAVLGAKGKAENHWPTVVAQVTLRAGGSVALDLPMGDAAFLYVVAGSLECAGQDVPEAHAAWFDADPKGTSIEVRSGQGGTAWLFSSTPIQEPVVAYGPFVMSTRDEVVQAVRDYQEGRFGEIPA